MPCGSRTAPWTGYARQIPEIPEQHPGQLRVAGIDATRKYVRIIRKCRPHSQLVALDMNAGEKLCHFPVGEGPRDHEVIRRLELPPLGNFEKQGEPLLTKTLLFIGQGFETNRLGVCRNSAVVGVSAALEPKVIVGTQAQGTLKKEAQVYAASSPVGQVTPKDPPLPQVHKNRRYPENGYADIPGWIPVPVTDPQSQDRQLW